MNIKKIIIVLIIVALVCGLAFGFYTHKQLNKSVVSLSENSIIYIPTGSDYEQVIEILKKDGGLVNSVFFDFLAKKKNFPAKVKPGRYLVKDGMNANELINMLRAGNQIPVKLTFNNIRFLPKLAGIVSEKLELDSTNLMKLLNDESYINGLGYTKETVISIFLPNTYELWWNTNEEQFVKRMLQEHKKFWNSERLSKAKKMKLSPTEISTLASIIQEETNRSDEMSKMAGVLMNRLAINMLLQVDPTARFAYGDFSVKRITYDYLKIDSPYNTYIYPGLPPGPICMPNPITIDKVLDYEKHRYFYYCAKPDNSGSHVFATNLRSHNNNARAYHRYLNKRRIMR